ncbi:hypothetical protein MTP99_009269 [Tenebrio molitor]|nr:hypothetical protein MTP99_009269 [Tenebrio molitor]
MRARGVPRVLRREGYKGLLHRGLYTVYSLIVSLGTGCVPVWSGQFSLNFPKQIGGVGRETSQVVFYTQKSACHFTPLPKKRDCGSFQSLALVKVSWATRRRSSSTEERFERRDESALVGVVSTKQRHRSTKRHRSRSHLEGRW